MKAEVCRCTILLALCVLTGCKMASPIKTVSPRVTGRVVNARTRDPVRNVGVQRQSARDTHRLMDPPKGGELMKQPAIVRTDAEGNFTLVAEHDLTVFRSTSWLSVNLLFEHPRYERFVATYTAAQATNNVNGEALLKTGDVLLVPRGK